MTLQTDIAKDAARSEETSEVFLELLTIDHPDLAAPIRVVNDEIDLTSNGEVFTAFPFELTLPNDEEGRVPRARLRIDNVDRRIVQAIREVSSAPTVQIEVARASAPDVVEVPFPVLQMAKVRYDAFVVESDLILPGLENEPYPAAKFTPKDYPGLFS